MIDFQTIIASAEEGTDETYNDKAQAIRDEILTKAQEPEPVAPAVAKTAAQIREEFRNRQAQVEEVVDTAQTVQAEDIAAAIPNCDLECFQACLDLKSFAPYEVIETCVTSKC